MYPVFTSEMWMFVLQRTHWMQVCSSSSHFDLQDSDAWPCGFGTVHMPNFLLSFLLAGSPVCSSSLQYSIVLKEKKKYVCERPLRHWSPGCLLEEHSILSEEAWTVSCFPPSPVLSVLPMFTALSRTLIGAPADCSRAGALSALWKIKEADGSIHDVKKKIKIQDN